MDNLFNNYSFYKSDRHLYIEKPYEGKVILANGYHGGESYTYVDYIEFEGDISENERDEIELFVETNLLIILNKAEKI